MDLCLIPFGIPGTRVFYLYTWNVLQIPVHVPQEEAKISD